MTMLSLETKLEMFDLDNSYLMRKVSEYDADAHLANLDRFTVIPIKQYNLAEKVTTFAKGISINMDARKLTAIKESPGMHTGEEGYDERIMKKEYVSLCGYDAKLQSMIKETEECKRNLRAVPKELKIHGIPEFDKWFSETSKILDCYEEHLGVIVQVVDYAICNVRNELIKGNHFIWGRDGTGEVTSDKDTS